MRLRFSSFFFRELSLRQPNDDSPSLHTPHMMRRLILLLIAAAPALVQSFLLRAAPPPLLAVDRARSGGISANAALAEAIKDTVASNDVVVYSKSWCPYCQRCKAALADMNVTPTVVELDELDDGAKIQAELLSLTGQRTVPNVFVKGAHLGGNDDTQRAISSGKLAQLLSE